MADRLEPRVGVLAQMPWQGLRERTAHPLPETTGEELGQPRPRIGRIGQTGYGSLCLRKKIAPASRQMRLAPRDHAVQAQDQTQPMAVRKRTMTPARREARPLLQSRRGPRTELVRNTALRAAPQVIAWAHPMAWDSLARKRAFAGRTSQPAKSLAQAVQPALHPARTLKGLGRTPGAPKRDLAATNESMKWQNASPAPPYAGWVSANPRQSLPCT